MPIRVAVFEDSKLVRDSFELTLNGTEGYLCTGAFSSCNNLMLDIQRSQPDVVLMDIEMDGINGIDATSKIRQAYPEIKVLIQTVVEDDDKIFAAICAGASGYILKKTTPAKLVEAIREVDSGGSPMSPAVANKVFHLLQQLAPRTTTEQEILTSREKEILSLMMEGDNFRMIAKRIFLSYDTVRTHVRSIYKKLHVTSVNQAIVKGFRQRLP